MLLDKYFFPFAAVLDGGGGSFIDANLFEDFPKWDSWRRGRKCVLL
jgi:hypothetical protein